MTREEAIHEVWATLEAAAFLVRYMDGGEPVDLAMIQGDLERAAAAVAAVRAQVGDWL